MLQEASAQGVKHLVLTPHLYEADIIKSTQEWKQRVSQGENELRDLIEKNNVDLTVTIAAEVRYQDMLPIILDELDVLIGNKYLLLEFSFHNVPNHLERIIYDITRRGITPIIAHPERIKPWQRDPQRLEELINMGCPTQLDIGSFLGKLGPNSQKLANFLLERDAVHLVGSDSHNLDARPVFTKPGYDWLVNEFGTEYANLLLMKNPEKILAGDPVEVYPVDLRPPDPSLKERIFSFFKSS
jgi:protein-tyrosine phosphatase